MEEVVKKKRGRPPKNKGCEEVLSVEKSIKKRGRPPKNKKVDTPTIPTQDELEEIKEVFNFPVDIILTETVEEKKVEVEEKEEEPPKRKRGRPPKIRSTSSLIETENRYEEVSNRGRPRKEPSTWPHFGFEKAKGKLPAEEAKQIQMMPYFCEEDSTEYSVVKPTVDEAAEALNEYLVSQGFPKRYRD